MALKVLVVDDSLTARQLLTSIINRSGDMEVVGEASNGEQAYRLVSELSPDVLLMDIVMPKLDGLDATRKIMQTTPLPIVLITSGLDVNETGIAFQAMQAGALSVLQKPSAMNPAEINHVRNTVRSMSQVKVIHHYTRHYHQSSNVNLSSDRPAIKPEVVAIASSTGGPAALAHILSNLPATFPLPILIVQHISGDFVESLAKWLEQVCPLNVRVAKGGELPRTGDVYIAPGNAHLYVKSSGRLALDTVLGSWRYMPSCDVLLHSVAEVYPARSIGIVLTGMGDDGADGLRALYTTGALTCAQDEDTSVVYGMPYEAVQRGGAQHVLPLDEIASFLQRTVGKGANQ